MTFREETESSCSIASEDGSQGKGEVPSQTENEEDSVEEDEKDISTGHKKVSLSLPTHI
jgi:hypothetical protein